MGGVNVRFGSGFFICEVAVALEVVEIGGVNGRCEWEVCMGGVNWRCEWAV